jgi:hypothetical protein
MGPNAASPSLRSGEVSETKITPTDGLQSFVSASIV